MLTRSCTRLTARVGLPGFLRASAVPFTPHRPVLSVPLPRVEAWPASMPCRWYAKRDSPKAEEVKYFEEDFEEEEDGRFPEDDEEFEDEEYVPEEEPMEEEYEEELEVVEEKIEDPLEDKEPLRFEDFVGEVVEDDIPKKHKNKKDKENKTLKHFQSGNRPPMNNEISAKFVHLLNVRNMRDVEETVTKEAALRMAQESKTNLIQISKDGDEVFAALLQFQDYSKWRAKELLKKSKFDDKGKRIKELRFNTTIGDADYDLKIARLREFLGKGHKVKVYILFRRVNTKQAEDVVEKAQMQKEAAQAFLDDIRLEIEGFGKIQGTPSVSSVAMGCVIHPVKVKLSHEEKVAQVAKEVKRERHAENKQFRRPW